MTRALLAGCAFLLATAGASPSAQAPRVVAPAGVQSAGLLRRVLAGAHEIREADSLRPVVLTRGDRVAGSLVVAGGDAHVAGSFDGSIVVVGGDLYLRPGASIRGDAIAVGGSVYESTLARVGGTMYEFRDHTYDYDPAGGGVFRHRAIPVDPRPVFALPLLAGFRIPLYDRVNGASVAWGPVLGFGTRIEAEPIVTYRSDLGAVDPSLAVRADLARGWNVGVRAGRFTPSNEWWIRSDFLNSLLSFINGGDTRNYYRADLAEVLVARRIPVGPAQLTAGVGLLTERAWSVGPDTGTTSGPWSISRRTDSLEGMWRPNPRVDRGRTASVIGDASLRWREEDIRVTGLLRLEAGLDTPTDATFSQATLDLDIRFRAVADHEFMFATHVVASGGDVPAQRFAYVGGSGTLPVTDTLLAMGGDRLFHAEGRYTIPIRALRLPFLGSPSVAARYLVGSAGRGDLPDFVQNVGARVSLSFLRVEYLVDPASRESNLSFGIAFAR